MTLTVCAATDKIHTCSHVTPLVTSANLQSTSKFTIQMEKIISLKDHVAEFSIGDASFVSTESALNGIFLHHHIYREILTNITKIFNNIYFGDPVVIIDQNGLVSTEVYNCLQLFFYALNIMTDLVRLRKGLRMPKRYYRCYITALKSMQ